MAWAGGADEDAEAGAGIVRTATRRGERLASGFCGIGYRVGRMPGKHTRRQNSITLPALAHRAGTLRPWQGLWCNAVAMWIDSHCHLDAPEFDADRDAVLAAARAAG
ncbi:MAG: hypothetical protein OEU93_16635, partial [Rubrivivax sp.]|nr:hypothetical protein [Rubrivivax sp.]